MSKSKIKTREKGKDIKVLDKSAVVGQRMKSAFIRSKKNAEALMDDRQATPNVPLFFLPLSNSLNPQESSRLGAILRFFSNQCQGILLP